MSSAEAIKELYNKCKDIDIEESMDLIVNAKSDEEKEFYNLLSDYALRKKQKEVIAQKRF